MGTLRAAITDRTGLSHAVMIYYARVLPKPGDEGTGSRHAAARLAAHDDGAHAGRCHIDMLLGGDLGQSDGIGGSAAQHGGGGFDHSAQSRGATHAAAGNGKAAHARGGFEADPES